LLSRGGDRLMMANYCTKGDMWVPFLLNGCLFFGGGSVLREHSIRSYCYFTVGRYM